MACFFQNLYPNLIMINCSCIYHFCASDIVCETTGSYPSQHSYLYSLSFLSHDWKFLTRRIVVPSPLLFFFTVSSNFWARELFTTIKTYLRKLLQHSVSYDFTMYPDKRFVLFNKQCYFKVKVIFEIFLFITQCDFPTLLVSWVVGSLSREPPVILPGHKGKLWSKRLHYPVKIRVISIIVAFIPMHFIDPRGRPTITVITISARVVCLSVRPYFSKSRKTKLIQARIIVIATSGTVGLAEWNIVAFIPMHFIPLFLINNCNWIPKCNSVFVTWSYG